LTKEYLEYINEVLDITPEYIENSIDTAEKIEKARTFNIEKNRLNFQLQIYKAKNLWQKIDHIFPKLSKSLKAINNMWELTKKYVENKDNTYRYVNRDMLNLSTKKTAINYLIDDIKNV